MTNKNKGIERKKRTAEKVFSLIGGFLALIISIVTFLIGLVTDGTEFKTLILLICSLVVVLSGLILNKKTNLAFSLMLIFSIIGLLTNTSVFIFPSILVLIGLFITIIKGRTIVGFFFSTLKAITVSVLFLLLIVYFGFIQPIISRDNEINNFFTKLDNLEKDFNMVGTEKDIEYHIYEDYSEKKVDLDTAIKTPPALWVFFPEIYSFIIIKPNFQKMVDTANTVEYMKSRVFPEGYIAKKAQEIILEYIETGVIKAIEIPCEYDYQCLPTFTCYNHQCKQKGEQGEECYSDDSCKDGYTCFKYKCERIECQTNNDCRADEFCGENKQCKKKECEKNEECKGGEYCHPKGVCSKKQCNKNSDCGQNRQCDKTYWSCNNIVCKKDSDCDGGFYCDEIYSNCEKIFSRKEVKSGFVYETMLSDGTVFIWCNRDSKRECPTGLICAIDSCGDYLCQPECKKDSDCEKNYQCIHSVRWEHNTGITASEEGYCEHQDSYRKKCYSNYKERKSYQEVFRR